LPTSVPFEKVIGSSAPRALRRQIDALELPGDASVLLDVSPPPDPFMPHEIRIQWLYVLVAPFPTVRDGVTSDELRSAWSAGASPAFQGKPLLMAESTLAAFQATWGEPVSGSVRSVEEDQLLDTAWSESAWAIIPFEELSPRWKVLTIDGQSPIRKNFDIAQYPLITDFTLQSSVNIQFSNSQLANYDPSKITTVVLTGVTALVRATAFKMERKGVTYPGEGIRDLMREADIAHISNEVAFYSACPPPDPNYQLLVFCSNPKYIDLLTDIGADVVELTGNHFADYGRTPMDETVAIYNTHNIRYYGGGIDLQDSFEPALFEANGNRIAFLGCNRPDVGGPKVASETRPGAAPCDFDVFTAKIAELKSAGYIVIFTFQWYEDYVPYADPSQMDGFRRVADAGADIVSGSQAHFPKTMEFYRGSFIHYGLGNLFFDQMEDQDWMPTGIRREFLDRFVLYDGRLVGIELITALLEDYARPRFMTESERADFLREYFSFSGWNPVE
jgi:poly-gamma-glutamate synthesis protein (capsule biosynthesis protein)